MFANQLLNIITPPTSSAGALASWLQQERLNDLFCNLRIADKVLLYGSVTGPHGSVLLHGALVPQEDVEACLVSVSARDALVEWEGTPYDHPTCGLVYSGSDAWVELSPPHRFAEMPLYRRAQQLVFARSFAGVPSRETYYELAQNFAVAHGLHWMEERSAWCRLNDEGDMVDVAKLERLIPEHADVEVKVLWIDRQVLELHMAATHTYLLLNFDSTVYGENFHGFVGEATNFFHDTHGLYMKYLVGSAASYFRGTQVLKSKLDASAFGAKMRAGDLAPRKYAAYLTFDWKNDRVEEVSCDPAELASYFEPESPLPYETSIVFFKPEVLDKYRMDREKYEIGDRWISCRNSWYLKTFDVNDAGQVHTMICYLGNLPYSEQLYWKSFNEPPKDSISQRSFETDFLGKFSSVEDPLRDLKSLLREFGSRKPKWFKLHSQRAVDHLNYPLTASTKQWDDCLIDLAKVVVEGLQHAYLQREAKARGYVGGEKFGSIKWARELMGILEVDPDRIVQIIGPLEEVQNLRSKLSAHVGGATADSIRKDLLRQHGTSKSHITDLVRRLVGSLRAIDSIIT